MRTSTNQRKWVLFMSLFLALALAGAFAQSGGPGHGKHRGWDSTMVVTGHRGHGIGLDSLLKDHNLRDSLLKDSTHVNLHLKHCKDTLRLPDSLRFHDLTIESDRVKDSLELDTNLVCNGKLHLKKGVLKLHGKKLHIKGGCDADSGSIVCDSLSEIIVDGTDSTSFVRFGHGRQHIGKLAFRHHKKVVIQADTLVTDTLDLVDATLDLSNITLMVQGPINNQNSFLSGTVTSNLNLFGSGKADTLRFTPGKEVLASLKIMKSMKPFVLASNLRIADSLCLDSAKLKIKDGVLRLDTTCRIKGVSHTSYIITGDSGAVLQPALRKGKEIVFPIGTDDQYAPAVITQTFGADTSCYKVSINKHVFANGYNGALLDSLKPMAKVTWHVACTAKAFKLNLKLKLADSTVTPGFNPKKCYISHFERHRWDSIPPVKADTTSDSLMVISRTDISSLSPFTVMSVQTPTALAAVKSSSLTVYPDPASDVINLNMAGSATNQVTITDAIGKVRRSLTFTGESASIGVSNLPTGLYLIRVVSDGKVATTGKFAVR